MNGGWIVNRCRRWLQIHKPTGCCSFQQTLRRAVLCVFSPPFKPARGLGLPTPVYIHAQGDTFEESAGSGLT